MKKKRIILSFFPILLVITLALFLRFYMIRENPFFNGELGHNYLAIKNFIHNKQIPLLGPPTSHPWLSFGPLYYWLFAPVLILFHYDPLAGAYFMATAGVVVVIFNYYFISRLINKSVALLSSFLIAFSPLFTNLAWESRFYSLVPLLFYPFYYFFVKSLKEKPKNFIWSGIFLGLMLNFHLSAMVLFPAIITLLIVLKKINLKSLLYLILGLAVSNLPFLWFNLLNHFQMLTKLLLWIPYRIIGFLGFYPKNNFSFSFLVNSSETFLNFTGQSILANYRYYIFIIFAVAIVFVASNIKKKGKYYQELLVLIIFFLFSLAAIVIHGDAPLHYYLPIFPLPILFVSFLLTRLLDSKWLSLLVYVFLTIAILLNLKFYFSPKTTGGAIAYSTQQRIVKTIIKDANGRSFSLKRTGPYDYFTGNYAQNYQYLLWLYGNEPIENAALVYTIQESGEKILILKEITK